MLNFAHPSQAINESFDHWTYTSLGLNLNKYEYTTSNVLKYNF